MQALLVRCCSLRCRRLRSLRVVFPLKDRAAIPPGQHGAVPAGAAASTAALSRQQGVFFFNNSAQFFLLKEGIHQH